MLLNVLLRLFFVRALELKTFRDLDLPMAAVSRALKRALTVVLTFVSCVFGQSARLCAMASILDVVQ